MIGFFYVLLIILASTLGSVAGIGGGVIIKPLMDAMGFHPVSDISFFSSLSVFTMSIISVFRRLKLGCQIRWSLLLTIMIGSVFGGILGHWTFEQSLHLWSGKTVLLIQIVTILLTLVFSLWATGRDSYFFFDGFLSYLFAGGFLGFLSSFLGIGGGPINVAFLLIFFGFTIQEATLYSLMIIFFSQASHLLTIGLTSGFSIYDLSVVPLIIPASIIGALLGSRLIAILSSEVMKKCFRWVILGVILINIYNLLHLL